METDKYCQGKQTRLSFLKFYKINQPGWLQKSLEQHIDLHSTYFICLWLGEAPIRLGVSSFILIPILYYHPYFPDL